MFFRHVLMIFEKTIQDIEITTIDSIRKVAKGFPTKPKFAPKLHVFPSDWVENILKNAKYWIFHYQ